ncbi:hypothetical protein AOQ84DRAFT_286307, partial [Glonium stellatum]
LHPQVAVILNIPKRWHIWLQVSRWLSILPAVFWAFYCGYIMSQEVLKLYTNGMPASMWQFEQRIWFTEVFLATLWCIASAYISFFFIDCLMSRWLLHYPPGSALIRLATMDLLNMLLTNQFVNLCGAKASPPRLFVAWICIASTLTILYHITHRRTNIKRETSTAVRVFSPLTYLSLCLILFQLHYPVWADQVEGNALAVPLFVKLKAVGEWFAELGRAGMQKQEV